MKEIKIVLIQNKNSDSYDYIEIDGHQSFSTSEFTESPEDSIYRRDQNSSKDVVKFAKKLFEDAGLNFEDYYTLKEVIYKCGNGNISIS